MTAAVEALTSVTGRFCTAVSGWTPARWAAQAPDGRSRSDVTFDLVQRLADLAADAEGQPHRVVPRLETPQALGDQVRVMVADLIAAEPPAATVAEATDLVTDVHRALSGPPVPLR